MRWIERLILYALAAGLFCLAFLSITAVDKDAAPAKTMAGDRQTELSAEASLNGVRVMVQNYGPGIALAALGVVFLGIGLMRKLHVVVKTADGGETTYHYFEPPATDRAAPPAVKHDDLEDLLLAVKEVKRLAPESPAAIRLERVYENVYKAGRLDPTHAVRIEELASKDWLSTDERQELNALKRRYPETFAPEWRD
ncbi:MAG TPA: hypothetical protein VLU25_19750 [Acidobacteriota bacterium]|nr:hypothetical protein [Acidobacteriota bacterium]